jgi:segregation and condensation protein B
MTQTPTEDPPTEPASAESSPPEAEPADVPVAPDGIVATDLPLDLSVLEALLLSTHHPLTPARLVELMDLPGPKPIRPAVAALNEVYDRTGRSFRIEQVAGGYQILTLPQFGETLKKLHQKEIDAKLTKAAVETLAIIAYKQPILRADVEAIRGVASGETIRSLMEKHLVKIAGRAEEPGRPILYGTTKRFLELFGLNTLRDLPPSQNLPVPSGTPK